MAARRTGYAGLLDADRRFEAMRASMDRLRALELAKANPSPAALALDHAITAVRAVANLLTGRLEFFELQRRHEPGGGSVSGNVPLGKGGRLGVADAPPQAAA